MNNTVAIVVTYNRKNLLEECIRALRSSERPCDILIVDNASTDDTAQLVEQFVGEFKAADGTTSRLIYENTGANLGGAGGFSFGVKRAYEQGYEYLWLMDDDTIVNPDALTKMEEARKLVGENFGFLSGMAIWTDGNPCRMNYHSAAADWNADKLLVERGIVKCQMATFVSFYTRREVVKEVGLPVKEYFIWGDDTEYSNRIANCFPSYFVSGSRVVHKMKSNESSETLVTMTDEARIRRSFYSIRNDLCTFRRNSAKTGFKTWLNTTVLWFKILCKAHDYKGLKLGVVWKATWAGLFFNPPIEKV